MSVLASRPLGFAWDTVDPFLFCVHHDDAYPAGTAELGPNASLAGRRLGNDFEGKDGWRMYHGQTVPGFPQHPHRGFETITLVRRGFIDHSDSLGATARFGGGDVQWMTAGKGIVHAEMFPLLRPDAGNPVELFQIWLNLPAANKFVPPHFSMLWAEKIPSRVTRDAQGPSTTLTALAGAPTGMKTPAPPPHSWASHPSSDVAIWTLALDAGATVTLPAAKGATTRRTLFFFSGDSLQVGTERFAVKTGIEVTANQPTTLVAGAQRCEVLMLQGRPIAEPVVQYGPFVMNTAQQIHQAFADYQATQFGGWPWKRDDPVHAAEQGRFAQHADGRKELPPKRGS
jgi:quercetin 2,3-dioxygenase